jgi:hypothetical protein
MPLQRLALDPPGRDCPAAEDEGQIRGLAAQGRARSVRPVEVGGLQAASFDAGAETLVHAARGELVKDNPDGVVG